MAPGLGADVSELHDAQLSDDFHYTLFPNVTFNIFGVSAWVFRHRPHPTDPQRMLFDFWDLLRAPAHSMARPAHRHVVLGDELALDLKGGGGTLLGQDLYNLPRIQAGMRSRGSATSVGTPPGTSGAPAGSVSTATAPAATACAACEAPCTCAPGTPANRSPGRTNPVPEVIPVTATSPPVCAAPAPAASVIRRDNGTGCTRAGRGSPGAEGAATTSAHGTG